MIIVNHTGKKGSRGADADNALGVSDVSGYKVLNPYLELLKPNKLSEFITWSRQTEGAFNNRYGEQDVIPPALGRQVLSHTNSFSSPNWFTNNDEHWSVTATGVSDPDGGNNASEITLTDPTGSDDTVFGFTYDAVLGSPYRVSMYIKIVSGAIDDIECAMAGADYSGGSFFDLSEIGSSWIRLSAVITANVAGIFRLKISTSGAVINLYQINVTEGIGLYPAINNNVADSVSFNTGSPIYRANQLGYLIEPTSTNICKYSEDLSQWSISGATVSPNVNFDTFDQGASNTLITINALSASAVLSGLDITSGVEYTVSFFAVVESGSVASMGVSLGGGEVVSIAPTSSYERIIAKCRVGTGDNISFTFTSSTSGSQLVIAGVQIEASEATGYIPTAPDTSTRLLDSVVCDTDKLPSLAQPFTVHLKWNEVLINDNDKYIFNVDDSLTARVNGNEFILAGNGSDLLSITLDNPESMDLFVVFNGSSVKLYIDSVLAGETSYSGEALQPSTMFIGAYDSLGAGTLNGYIETLTFWDYATTQNDLKYIGGA